MSSTESETDDDLEYYRDEVKQADLYAGELLIRQGYIVLPFLPRSRLAGIRQKIDEELGGFPEFQHPLPANYEYKTPRGKTKRVAIQYQGGGFAALGNPSAFHNNTVRQLREWVMHPIVSLMRGVLRTQLSPEVARHYKLEQIIDRLMVRPAGLKPTAEAWHRDETPSAEASDMIFGGWVNLDDRNQMFSGSAGTHRITVGDAKERGKGFFCLPKAQHARYKQRQVKVVIPPGHVFVFFENMVHEVVAKAQRYDQYRLFTAWRLTQSDQPLHGTVETEACLQQQGVMRLKSNQMPPMYAKLWATNHWRRLSAWSQALFPPALLRTHTIASGRYQGTSYEHVDQHMPSLQALGLRKYRDYTAREKQLYWPNTEWTVWPINQTGRRISIRL